MRIFWSKICARPWKHFPPPLSRKNRLHLLPGCYQLRVKAQKRRPRLSRITRETATLKESGRQDLNLRPLGPEGARAFVYDVPAHITDSHPFDRFKAVSAVPVDSLAPAGTTAISRGEPLVNAPVAVERLLTAAEAAVRLRVCRATVYALCERGELPHVRVSNAIRVAPADLEAFIARGHSGATGVEA
jgi:excisionase family DNA binding protein